MSLFKKLFQYNFIDLLRIAFFKLGYKVVLCLEKKKKFQCGIIGDIDSEYIFTNLDLTDFNKYVFAEPVFPLQNKVNLFGTYYPRGKWLEDPISGKCWPVDVFFYDAKTKLEGYGDVKYVLEKNKLNHVVDLAIAFRNTNDESYIKYIESELRSWTSEVKYNRSVVNKIIMDSAFRVINLIQVSLLCGNNQYFRQIVYPIIHNVIKNEERHIRVFSTPKWYKTGNGANHVIGEMIGLIVAQKWLWKNDNESYTKCVKKERRWLFETLDKLVSRNGVYLEYSSNYTRLVTEFLIFYDLFGKIINDTGDNDYIEKRYLMPLLNYIGALSYNDSLPNFGDNDSASVLTAFKKSFDDLTPIFKYSSNLIGNKPEIVYPFINDGNFIWKANNENSIYVFVRYGEFAHLREGASVHVHCDLLSIILSLKGIPVFVDNGCFYYNTSEEIRRENISVCSHNTVFINNIEQADFNGRGYFDYPKSDIINNDTNTFSGYVNYKGILHFRNIIIDDKSIVINDKITGNIKEDDIVSINYLLSDRIIPQITDKDSIDLYCEERCIANVEFEGINIGIKPSKYHPYYGASIRTNAICGSRLYGNKKEITTIIKLNG